MVFSRQRFWRSDSLECLMQRHELIRRVPEAPRGTRKEAVNGKGENPMKTAFKRRGGTTALARNLVSRFAKNHAALMVTLALCCTAHASAQNAASDSRLRIDIPTKLDKANVVIDFGHAVFHGDVPFALGDINLLADDVRDWNAKGAIVVIFHGDAAYLVLNDESYNSNRHVTSGNPFKNFLNGLMAKGVRLELCGATAKGNDWGNANLLPGIKVNAMVRLTQLEQDGYTMIYQ
jgi:intracellular sulfur oxidation DsrE/DsrF family protein